MKVEIFDNHTPDLKPRLMSTWTLAADGTAACDDPIDQEDRESCGALGGGKIHYPKDGEAFLRALPSDYSGRAWIDAVLTE